MPLFRSRRSGDAYAVVKRTALDDRNLSWKAKGLMAYLMALHPEAELRKSDLLAASADGKDALTTGLAELLRHGYVEAAPIIDSKGREVDTEYVVSDDPALVQATAENPPSPEHVAGDHHPSEKVDEGGKPAIEGGELSTNEQGPRRKIRSDRDGGKSALRKTRHEQPGSELAPTDPTAENPPLARAPGNSTPTSLFEDVVTEEGVQGKPIAKAKKKEAPRHLFRNSGVATLEAFKAGLAKEEAIGIDLAYYFGAVGDWSNMNEGVQRSDHGWLSTGRTFMRRDLRDGKLAMVKTDEQQQAKGALQDWYHKLG